MNRCLSLLLLGALWIPVHVYAYPPPDRSFVQERVMLDESGSRYLSGKRCYYDGLGNLYQVWHMGVTPAGANLITHIEYDKAGRPVKNWLPVPVSGDVTNALPVETVRNGAGIFYGQDSCFYSETLYEPSPLGRVEKVYGPGQEWCREGGRCERAGYLVNTAQGEYSARYFYESNGSLRASGNYPAGSLYISQRTDEDENISCTFTDKMGQIVLVRQMEGAVPHDTYHVYNDYGDKVFMLSPKAADALGDGWWTADQEPVKELAYVYRYDARRRCTAKKYPGADWIYYAYDLADRPIFSQDGNQRIQGVWTFIVPDAMGRPVITGTCKSLSVPVVNGKIITASWDGTTGGSFKQTGYVLPADLVLESPEVNIVSYYDNYDFKKVASSFVSGSLYNYAMPSGIPDTRYGTDESVHEHKGLLTGQEVRELGSSSRSLRYFIMTQKDA